MKPLYALALTVPAVVSGAQPVHHAALRELFAQKLGLTQAQKAAVHQVLQAHHAALKARHEAAFQAHADLFQALANPQTTPDQITALEAKASAAHLAMELEINQVVREIAPTLTAEQIAKAQEVAAELRSRVEGFRAFFAGAEAPKN